jgi:hypothetical protein
MTELIRQADRVESDRLKTSTKAGRSWEVAHPHPQEIGSSELRGKHFSHKNQFSYPLGLGSPAKDSAA